MASRIVSMLADEATGPRSAAAGGRTFLRPFAPILQRPDGGGTCGGGPHATG